MRPQMRGVVEVGPGEISGFARDVLPILGSGLVLWIGQAIYAKYEDPDTPDVKAAKQALKIRDSAAPTIQGLREAGESRIADQLRRETDIRAARVLAQHSTVQTKRRYQVFPVLVFVTLFTSLATVVLGPVTVLVDDANLAAAWFMLGGFSLMGAALLKWIEGTLIRATELEARKIGFHPDYKAPTD